MSHMGLVSIPIMTDTSIEESEFVDFTTEMVRTPCRVELAMKVIDATERRMAKAR